MRETLAATPEDLIRQDLHANEVSDSIFFLIAQPESFKKRVMANPQCRMWQTKWDSKPHE